MPFEVFQHIVPQGGGWKPFLIALISFAALISFMLWIDSLIGKRLSHRAKMLLTFAIVAVYIYVLAWTGVADWAS